MSKPKAKGTAAETAVVRYLRTNGFPHAERRTQQGVADRGDVAGVPGVVLEVKNCAKTELSAWVDEAEAEAINDGYADVYAVVHKRRRKGNPGDWYCTMPFDVFVHLLRGAR